MQYTPVINSRAKRLSIVVHPIEGLRVVMPRQLSDAYVQRVLKKHAPWIQHQTSQFESKQQIFQKYQFVDGGTTLLHGQPHSLLFQRSAKKSRVIIDDTVISIHHSSIAVTAMQKIYLQWCKTQLRSIAEKEMAIVGEQLRVRPSGLSIRGQKTMWGSCSEHGKISLNWKLLCVPDYVREYVIVHELSHMRYLNHSKQFWATVRSIHSKPKAARTWLDQYGDLVQFVTKQFS